MNGFQFLKIVSLFRLPNPRPGEVLGLVGTNGIGKSTALKILAGKQKPNLGKFTVSSPLNGEIACTTSKKRFIFEYLEYLKLAGKFRPLFPFACGKDPPDWTEILAYFRGSELQNYFTKLLEDDLKAIIKPQYVDQIPRAVKVCIQRITSFFRYKQDATNDYFTITDCR